MSTGNPAAHERQLIEYGVCTALAGWFIATVLIQHPNNVFSRVRRRLDPTGVLLPNWRFFAPNPGSTDYRLLHRLLDADGTEGEWRETLQIPERRWTQMFWFPERRSGKGTWDILGGILHTINERDVTATAGYRKIRDLISVHAAADHVGPPPQGFQFLVVSDTGFDEEPEPVHLFASGLEPWRVHELATAP